jgi:hypothetical protein
VRYIAEFYPHIEKAFFLRLFHPRQTKFHGTVAAGLAVEGLRLEMWPGIMPNLMVVLGETVRVKSLHEPLLEKGPIGSARSVERQGKVTKDTIRQAGLVFIRKEAVFSIIAMTGGQAHIVRRECMQRRREVADMVSGVAIFWQATSTLVREAIPIMLIVGIIGAAIDVIRTVTGTEASQEGYGHGESLLPLPIILSLEVNPSINGAFLSTLWAIVLTALRPAWMPMAAESRRRGG